tara:strand:+ start:317 stop:811 length:495 start_codon:yes stop_codon:yes gene_type:complete
MFKYNIAHMATTLIFLCSLNIQLQAQAKDVNKEKFYLAMASTDLELIEAELAKLERQGAAAEQAFVGALVMKKAGALQKVGDKLETFKKGKEILEKAISAKPDNAEFRFLRLMIQENAPSILGYGSNIKEDAEMIDKKFNDLPPSVKDAIISYSKNSKVLSARL